MESKLCNNPKCGKDFEGESLYCSPACYLEHQTDLATVEEKPMVPESFFKITEMEIQKVNLLPGDTLMVTIKNDDIHQFALDSLRKQFLSIFPNNRTFIFGMGNDGDVKFAVVSQPEVSYCSNCDCGKKKAAEEKGKV